MSALVNDTSVPFEYFGGGPGASATQIKMAWAAFIAHLQNNAGMVGTLAPGIYDFSLIDTTDLTSAGAHVSISATVPGSVVLDGSGAVDGSGNPTTQTIFRTRSQGFSLYGVTTKNIQLVSAVSNTTGGGQGPLGDIPLIDIRHWTHEGGTLESPFNIRSEYTTADGQHKIGSLVLRDVHGSGGLCGVHCKMAIEQVEVDGFNWRNIVVPNTNANFDGNNSMTRPGRAVGLLLGEESNDAAALVTKSAVLNAISIYNVQDLRVSRVNVGTPPKPETSNCDGIRLNLHNIVAGPILVNKVSNTTHLDCTGVYLKAGNSVFSSLTIIDGGFFEGMLVLKGNTYGEGGGGNPIGGPLLLPSVIIKNTRGFVGNPAVSIYVDDIHFGTLWIEGAGGDVENTVTAGARYDGSGGIISTDNNTKKRLTIDKVVMRNIVIGNATTQDRCRVFNLDGFNKVDIGECIIDGLSNAGYFTGQSAGGELPIWIFEIGQSASMDTLRIGKLSVANITAHGKAVTAISIKTGAGTIGKIQLDDWMNLSGIGSTFAYPSGGNPIGLVELNNCDLSQVGNSGVPQFVIGMSTPPGDVRLNNVKPYNGKASIVSGAPTLGTNWADAGGGVYTKTAGAAGDLDYPIAAEAGQSYMLTWTSSGGTAGTFTVSLEGGTRISGGGGVGANLTRQWFFTANPGNNVVRFTGASAYNGSISAVKMTRVS